MFPSSRLVGKLRRAHDNVTPLFTSTHNMRPVTYGRKSSKRHVETTQRGLSNSLDDRPRKRSKTVVETVEPIAAADGMSISVLDAAATFSVAFTEEVHETKLKDTTGRNTLVTEVTPEPGP